MAAHVSSLNDDCSHWKYFVWYEQQQQQQKPKFCQIWKYCYSKDEEKLLKFHKIMHSNVVLQQMTGSATGLLEKLYRS